MITLGKGSKIEIGTYDLNDCTGHCNGWKPFHNVKFLGPKDISSYKSAEAYWKLDGPGLEQRKMNDIVSTVADWYVCGAIATGALGHIDFNPDLLDEFKINGKVKIGNATPQVKAILEYRKLTHRLASVFNDYLFYACSRESRYLDSVAQKLSMYDAKAVYGWRLYHNHFGPLKTSEKLMKCFDGSNTEWESDFGGYSWHEIASVLNAYHAGERYNVPFTAENFIDITVSLEHNNGCVLNKINWDENNSIASWGDDTWHSRFPEMCEAQANDLDQLANEFSTTQIRNIYRKVVSSNA